MGSGFGFWVLGFLGGRFILLAAGKSKVKFL